MKQIRLPHLLLLLLTLLSVHTGWSQGTTTSSMTGTITDQSGAGLPGATVIAIHTPTNTQYVAPTNSEGRFNLQNMRVGGPYTVRVTFVGYQDVIREGIYLILGQTQRLDINLSETSTQLAGVTVTGSDPRSLLNTERTGPVTNISTQAIERLPSVNRSLNDFLRLTPQSASTTGNQPGSIGGGNYRQNNITVDGSDFNNNFGIGTNLPAGGSPISLDAIETVTVNIAPFDVRQSGFVGSAVNAITRSGTNEFSGSVYEYYRNQNYFGNEVGNDKFVKPNTHTNQFGFRLGGPIIKDKLFFFVNAERSKEINPGQQNIASTDAFPYGGSNSPANVVRPSATLLDQYSTFLSEKYGYETGPYQGYNFESQNTRILGRLDWQLNNNHHISVRYNQVESKSPSFVSTSRSIGSLTAFPNTRTSNFGLPYQNSNYFQEANFYSLAAEWNGTFGKYFNTLRGTYTHQNDPRSSNSTIFPFVDILDGSVTPVNGRQTSYGNPYTSFGYEPFTYGNLRDVETYSAVDFVTATHGNHTLTAGGQFDLQTTKNGFQRAGTSYYAFNSWDDFATGKDPVDFALTYSLLPNYEQAFPRYKTAQGSLFIQDEYAVTDRLRVTGGLRAELNAYLSVPEVKTHPLVAELNFLNGKKIDTGVLPQNRVLLSPRIGFNWDAKGDRSLQVRGGSGIFAGRVPTVWVVAQSGDAGLLQVTQSWTRLNSGELPDIMKGKGFNPDPAAYRPTTQPTPGTVIPSAISATDPNFRNPQAWKSSLAVDAKLPGGFVGTLEGIYTYDIRVAIGQNYNLVEPQKLTVSGYADNRDIYPNSNTQKFVNPLNTSGQVSSTGNNAFNAIVLTNAKKGYYWSATAKLEKQFNNGLFASLAYVRSDQRIRYDGSGDQLINTWSLTPVVNNANNPALSYSSFVVPSRLVGSFSYKKEYLNHLATQVSLFYSGSIQGRFSYVYGGDLNRDGQSGNDLIYVPKDASEITFTDFNYGTTAAPNNYTARQQSDLFFRYIEQDPYLNSRRGQYAERNGAKYPWRNQFDFRFAQDVFVTAIKRNTLQFTFDVFNLGNLLNKNWGLFQTVNNASILVPTNQASLVPGGTVKPTFRLATDRSQPITSTFRNTVSTSSTYYMQVGVRYIFN